MEVDSYKIVEALEKLAKYHGEIEEEQWMSEDFKICKKCAKLGWVMPFLIEDEDYEELKKLADEKEIINFFENYFEKDNYKNIFDMTKYFTTNEALINFQKVYLEAYKSFVNNNYIVATITLISIFEGICVEFILENKQTQNIKGDINKYVNEKYRNKKELEFNDRESLKIFIELLFKSLKNNEIDNDFILNRNIIMHGRCLDKIGKLESMKMFNAIGLLVELIEFN